MDALHNGGSHMFHAGGRRIIAQTIRTAYKRIWKEITDYSNRSKQPVNLSEKVAQVIHS